MSDTTEAAAKKIRAESPIVDAVCRQLAHQARGSQVEALVSFAEIFFSKAPPSFLKGRSPDTLAHLVKATFEFLDRSRPDRVDVEVVNPDVDNEGWYAPVTVIRTNVRERPFVVDTLREYLHKKQLTIESNVYPVVHVVRSEDGSVAEVRPSREGARRESLVHCEIGRVTDETLLQEIREDVRRRLEDVVLATDDFQAMVGALGKTVAELDEAAAVVTGARKQEVAEVQAFLRWLRDDAFVFLGYRGYELLDVDGARSVRVTDGSGLGILRKEDESSFQTPVALQDLPTGVRMLAEGGPLLIISKTNAESTVHRGARMDYIGVKRLDEKGRICGEHRFIGLFTSKAYTEPAQSIPILREKLSHILDQAGVQAGSHDYKEINTIFNSMPKEELFLASAEEIGVDVRTVLTSYLQEGVRISLRQDPLQRGVAVMVILPKDHFSGEVRKGIEQMLVEAYHGDVLNYHLALGEGDQARLHFYIGTSGDTLESVTPEELEVSVREITRSWQDRVREALEHVRPGDEARRLARRYSEAMSPEYQAATRPETAVQDILELEAMRADERAVAVALRERAPDEPTPDGASSSLNLYLRDARLILSDFMPILEAAGLRVLAVSPFRLHGADLGEAGIYDFDVQDEAGSPLDLDAGPLLGSTILAVRAGDASNDILNSLVLKAGLHWREVDILRTYVGYAFQLGAIPSRASGPGALVKYPEIARRFIEWFHAKFDPAAGGSAEERGPVVAHARALYTQALAQVESLAEDRVLRRMGVLLDATLRTNYFRHGGRNPTRRSGGVPYISLKFDARGLESVQRSRLAYEVYVRSSRMEGVHLRGASVARGGIRWSDRPDDFRTEILGLVNTQMVKNAVIVPGGSKGGFVPTRLPADPAARGEEAKAQYQTLIRGLLDITDNLDAEGNPVRPERVVSWDAADPYLVVAADKGTAKFSDVANGVAREYGFWLDDAFASGGSHGYDHKVVGITARGGWECVKRHFREMGKNIQEEPFTVVGIGDMSGDVFGNGMLLSRQIRLLAAFDHRHIFLDPDPDPETTYRERDRLFKLGHSSWEDYDRSLLSEGGAIIPRGTKAVTLHPRAAAALGLPEEAEPMDGESLIRAILKAPVELLWNGGIGTYVKASYETNANAGDPANDAVRISAPELRCQVVGEGGNLGLTQNARVEFALAGGRINTDAMDNSGGVDLSDREVNLKILLGPAVKSGLLGEDDRNHLLERLTDPVAELVLKDNWSQSLAISLDELRQDETVDEFQDLMVQLEADGLLDRSAERLPTLEVLVNRGNADQGLTRPELCVLLAYAKMSVKAQLLRSPLPDDQALRNYLLDYFPDDAIQAAGEGALEAHRLRREVITTQLTNDVVDLMGATFVHRVSRDTGRSPHEVVWAWVVAARLADHRGVFRELASQGRDLRTGDAYRWLMGLTRVLERTTRWILVNADADQSPGDFIRLWEAGISELRTRFAEVVAGPDREAFETRVEQLVELGADRSLAQRLITLRFLDQFLEILGIAGETGAKPVAVAEAFYTVSERLGIPWIRDQVAASASDDRWEQRAALALGVDLIRAHHRIVSRAVRPGADGPDASTAARDLLAAHSRDVDRIGRLLSEIRAEEAMSLAGISVAVRELAVLADRLEG
ncbi:MAG TPA: NAD-glutamate dehydrogenase [Longimicrobiales bacterium]|nr:NAD-glutamate dehydrogenase [Longimicrobiales bacterium]